MTMTDTTLRTLLDQYAAALDSEIGDLSDAGLMADVDHLRSMIPTIRAMLDTVDHLLDVSMSPIEDAIPVREKAMRWLGFLQGAFWVLGVYSIDEMRAHNKPPEEPFRDRT